MGIIAKLTEYNRQKSDYLDSYLLLNSKLMRSGELSREELLQLGSEKKRLIKRIELVDDKIVLTLAELKEYYAVDDLAAIKARSQQEKQALQSLKEAASDALKKMTLVKISDDKLKT